MQKKGQVLVEEKNWAEITPQAVLIVRHPFEVQLMRFCDVSVCFLFYFRRRKLRRLKNDRH